MKAATIKACSATSLQGSEGAGVAQPVL